MHNKVIKIGGATGFWGESDLALPQFLQQGDLDYIVFDYLAEVTMSLLARARSANPEMGYATDFVTEIVKPHLAAIASAKVRLISNAGGVNPEACGAAIGALIDAAGLSIKVAVVTGDDIMGSLEDIYDGAARGEHVEGAREMFSGDPLPPRDALLSANAYLGAFPIAEALNAGADIVITGRCVDSAVTLAACIHAFGWQPHQLDLLAAGSLVGHLIECGPQATGGNFTDWHEVADSLHEVGYPIAEIEADGTAVITKPDATGGLVNRGTVGEQLLYEIGDPHAYILPDVVCDFTQVLLSEVGDNRVRVTGAKGVGVPEQYKASLTWADGWRAGAVFWYLGNRAGEKARVFADEAIVRARRKLTLLNQPDYDEVLVELVGDESMWGDSARYVRSREVAIKVACRHQDKRAVALLMRELTGAALGAPPGLALFAGARPKPSPVVRLYSLLIDKPLVPARIQLDGRNWLASKAQVTQNRLPVRLDGAIPEPTECDCITVPLEQLAWARSGDKGDKANIGVLARDPQYLPWIARVLTPAYVADRFKHLMTSGEIDRYYLPGIAALNFVLHNALGGGGVASLRNDPQGKAYAQILLDTPIDIPATLIGA